MISNGSKLRFQLLKILPRNLIVSVTLRNGISFSLRPKTLDRAIVKDVWLKGIYHKYGITVEDGDTVIDIGAHIGIFSLFAHYHNPTGKIYAIEPYSGNYDLLQKNIGLNNALNVQSINVAISESNEDRTLYISNDNNTGGHSICFSDDSSTRLTIKTMTLRSFIERFGIFSIDFLKMDCEGCEFEILKDRDILSRIHKIAMEYHTFSGNSINELIKIFSEADFEIHTEPVGDNCRIGMLYARNRNFKKC